MVELSEHRVDAYRGEGRGEMVLTSWVIALGWWRLFLSCSILEGGANQEEGGKRSWASRVCGIFTCNFLIRSWLYESEMQQTGHMKRLFMLRGQLGRLA